MSADRARALLRPALLACAVAGLAAGLAAWASGAADWARLLWLAGAAPVLAGLVWEIVTSLRRGEIGLDIVAALSMSAAMTFGEHLAAAIVALMYAGGQYLESFAEARARREMTALLSHAPRSAMRHRDGELEEIALDAIAPGDRLLIRKGDVAPVDGTVAAGVAVLDQSTLTGEPLPVKRMAGEPVLSGSANVGEPFDLTAEKCAADSAFAAILRIVEGAQKARAPMARLADRYAIVFLAATVALAAAAWGLTDDPTRAVAVLVVATPCPLILAVPVALVAGLSRAAGRGVLVKSGKTLETLAAVRVLVLDKTGTLTHGRAALRRVAPAPGVDPAEALRLAASLDQVSRHAVAEALVAAARERGLALSTPSDVRETAGEGLEGVVEGRRVVVGGRRFVRSRLGAQPGDAGSDVRSRDAPDAQSGPDAAAEAGAVTVAVAADGAALGEIVMADALRDGAQALIAGLRGAGVARIVLATGDRRDVAEAVAGGLGLDAIRADLTPDEKVLVVLSERKHGPVMMVGDGVNDAPALAAADVGMAMGARGAAASAETADVVLLVDDVARALPAVLIARRSRAIALQSVFVGVGLSILGMVAAAFGLITPVQGALLQELIDVAAILNALRALGGGDGIGPVDARDGGAAEGAPAPRRD
ncbi:heavy metal translocating P-type ATPase [Rubrimonas cliftonensis]|uniref:P-type Zn(2+) transporter n=1 Tax=Rubrimonas cliftonensis TaxID=89524 RepID=A0A1H3X999_9RHOB|nr:heavy metal translocating P-type ATPase [Rubrimonas cliftonensis]SDZ95929.1 ATPase, P-type (transporting), HAD superfamily, subfamily IC/heavy metal translocating P-type ATPase [Rubrimonas cliftonensis]